MKKRLSALVMAVLLLAGMLPGEVSAAPAGRNMSRAGGTEALLTEGEAYVNPIYADVISEDDIDIPEEIEESQNFNGSKARAFTEASGEIEYCDTIEEAAAVLREGLAAREESIQVYYHGEIYSSEYFKDLCVCYIIPASLAETKRADEGDYLRYNYGGTGYRAEITKDDEGNYTNYKIYFTPKYFTNADQEAEVTAKVKELLENEFAFVNGTSDYEELYAVYDYICSNVTYDNENLENDEYTLKYTTYAALLNGTAVCQGYATLYYRLLRELGFSVRVATGYGGPVSEDETNYFGNHAWNIVQIDGKWYYADSTWDAAFSEDAASGTGSYQYFLKGTSDFDSLEKPYCSEGIHYLIMDDEFINSYHVEETKYTISQGEEEKFPAKELKAPSVTLSISQNNGKIKLTGNVTDYENLDEYYGITGHGFIYITKALLNTRTLTVNISGRTKVTVNGIGSTGSYSYSMTPKKTDTVYAVRAWVSYENDAGKTVYVYSDTICTSYDGIRQ